MQDRIVHLKQSGELLTDVAGMRWTPTALKKAAERIGEVQRQFDKLHVRGLMIVSGGGNVPDGMGRGENVREQFSDLPTVIRFADIIGRRSTTDNTIMLAAALADLGVPHVMFAAPDSGFSDIELGSVPVYNISAVQRAYQDGKVVLIAGGTGRGGRTTDTAVMEYTLWQKEAYPDVPCIALKATKFNGVYEADPKNNPDVRRYTQLSADTMLEDYERFKAVDRLCLETLHEAGTKHLDISLQVYAAEYTICQALENEHLGTIIHSESLEPAFA